MPVTKFIETSNSRSATLHRKGKRAESTVTKEFKAFGTSDDIEVHDHANTYFSNNRFYNIGDYQFMVESYTVEYVGDECFTVTATYTKLGADNDEQDEPLKRGRSFDTAGATQHMTQAHSERRYSRPGTSAPDQHEAINVSGDAVNGVDAIIPALRWTETYDVPNAYVTATYIKSVAELTGTVNQNYFRTFQPGEVLFAGCDGSQEWDQEKGDGPWRLSFKFIASPNRGLPTGVTGVATKPAINMSGILGIVKGGHEYLWVRYEDDVSDDTLLKKPKHVYVNKIYSNGNFSLLGIGS